MDKPHAELLAVARGDRPADILLRGGRVVDVFSGTINHEDVAIHGTRIAGVGHGYDADHIVDLDGAYIAPGLIDAHVHVESSMVTPPEFARAVVPRGTTTVVSDPHEIANVHGLTGIHYMLDASDGLPLTIFVMASSCVPATHMGTAGADLDAAALQTLLGHPRVRGLAEVMNFPGAIGGDEAVRAKIDAFSGRIIDGHAPGVTGRQLNAYVVAGPTSDHECVSPEEALERIRRGMWVFFREATNAQNLNALIPALSNDTRRRICLCTDDRQPSDLLRAGGIDAMVRRLIEAGTQPIHALQLATLNPAEYFRLTDRGGVAPGRRADLMILDDLETLQIREVYAGGACVARDGLPLWTPPPTVSPPPPSMSVDLKELSLVIPAREGPARVIRTIPDQIRTEAESTMPTIRDGSVVADPGRDLLKIVVVERHRGTGNVGHGLVSGVGLERGAIAGTVAHDHHNIIAIGADDVSLKAAIARVVELKGGLVATDGKDILAEMPLPVGGLMSSEPIESAEAQLTALLQATARLGSPLHDPFMTMAFTGLEVIPALKITDRGLVNVDDFTLVEMWGAEEPAAG